MPLAGAVRHSACSRRRPLKPIKLDEVKEALTGAARRERAIQARRVSMRRIGMWVLAATLAAGWATTAGAQAPAAPEKPKTLWEEHVLFAYIENSYVWNLGHTGRDDV